MDSVIDSISFLVQKSTSCFGFILAIQFGNLWQSLSVSDDTCPIYSSTLSNLIFSSLSLAIASITFSTYQYNIRIDIILCFTLPCFSQRIWRTYWVDELLSIARAVSYVCQFTLMLLAGFNLPPFLPSSPNESQYWASMLQWTCLPEAFAFCPAACFPFAMTGESCLRDASCRTCNYAHRTFTLALSSQQSNKKHLPPISSWGHYLPESKMVPTDLALSRKLLQFLDRCPDLIENNLSFNGLAGAGYYRPT